METAPAGLYSVAVTPPARGSTAGRARPRSASGGRDGLLALRHQRGDSSDAACSPASVLWAFGIWPMISSIALAHEAAALALRRPDAPPPAPARPPPWAARPVRARRVLLGLLGVLLCLVRLGVRLVDLRLEILDLRIALVELLARGPHAAVAAAGDPARRSSVSSVCVSVAVCGGVSCCWRRGARRGGGLLLLCLEIRLRVVGVRALVQGPDAQADREDRDGGRGPEPGVARGGSPRRRAVRRWRVVRLRRGWGSVADMARRGHGHQGRPPPRPPTEPGRAASCGTR